MLAQYRAIIYRIFNKGNYGLDHKMGHLYGDYILVTINYLVIPTLFCSQLKNWHKVAEIMINPVITLSIDRIKETKKALTICNK